ncbi:MAG: ABC transporter substrate-binding protein [Actinomycetota bacterium]
MTKAGSIVIVIILATLAAAGAGVFHSGSRQPHTDTIRLGAYEGDVGALEWIARDHGFFARVGLAVEIRGYPSGNAAIEAMRAGEVDIATAADLVVAKRSFDEPDLRILADICRYWNKGLVGRRDRGITAPADLKGKRIAVPATSSAEHNLMVFLAMQGLSAGDVQIVDLQPKDLVDATVAGRVDAAIVWQPHVLAIEKGLGRNAVKLMEGGTEAHLLLVARDVGLAPKGEAIRKLLRGLILAEDWVRTHPDDARMYLRQRFNLDPDYLAYLWPRMSLVVSLPQEILEAMDSEARWLAQTASRGRIPNYAETVHSAPLQSVKPSAVSVFTR